MEWPALTNKQVTNEIMNVPFIDLKRQYFLLKEEILNIVENIFSSGDYILGSTVQAFEQKAQEYLGCKFVLGVANATDALILALKALKIGHGDEVVLPVNSFIATAGAVAAVGATPIFCDVREDLNIDVSKIEALISKKTKAIMPVHLTGRAAEMDKIMNIAREYALFVIEDAAQSIGARYHNAMTGTLGDIGCFSLHPLKNLHVYGDGGFISTNNEQLYTEIKLLRNHGLANRDTCLQWGLNSRLDSIQAGIATLGLNFLDRWNSYRRATAEVYRNKLKQVVKVPIDKSNDFAVYHNFVILSDRRDELMKFLFNKKIDTKIHYPIPIHLQPAAASLGYQAGDFPMAESLAQQMLSLPIYSELQDDEINYVVDNILNFYLN